MVSKIFLFPDLYKGNKNCRKQYEVGKSSCNKGYWSQPAEGLGAIKDAEAEYNKTGDKYQRSVNDTNAGAMYSFYHRLFLIIII